VNRDFSTKGISQLINLTHYGLMKINKKPSNTQKIFYFILLEEQWIPQQAIASCVANRKRLLLSPRQ
jgi:hypothetical protein